MEQQFILRLHENLRHKIDLKDCKLSIVGTDRVLLRYQDTNYPGIVVKLPCIVESQKTMDCKQYYKTADISTLIVIYPSEDFNFEKEKYKHSMSGLSPPLKYCKIRRFRKKNTRIQLVEEIEKKVQDLLEKDSRAVNVEVLMGEEKDASDELSNFAAEIESAFTKKKVESYNPEKTEDIHVPENKILEESKELLSLRKKIEEKKLQVQNALNPILKRRFEVALKELEAEYKNREKQDE